MSDNTKTDTTRTQVVLAAVRGVAEGTAKAIARWIIDLLTNSN